MVEQMKKVIITGAQGQLGHDLIHVLSPLFAVFAFGKDELDITQLDQVRQKLVEIKPDIVIHAAAYTAVDDAEEKEQAKAHLINVVGSRNIAAVCAEIDASICFISTDYVYDGKANKPYQETDEPNPINYYGQTKLEGERIVQGLCAKHFIVRTSWLYGIGGPNFVKTMLRLASVQASSGKSEPLNVVNDQCGSPTYARDLAYFILELINSGKFGIYHASNEGACTWYDFAKAIFEEADLVQDVFPCSTEQFPRPAPRPKYSVLDNKAIREGGLTPLRPWYEALKAFIKELQQSQ